MATKKQKTLVSVKLSQEELARIDRLVQSSRKQTGFEVTRSDVVRKLIAIALPKMEK
jgi:Arc/MetJ-type ribon-helix-helix transcriptional regulator